MLQTTHDAPHCSTDNAHADSTGKRQAIAVTPFGVRGAGVISGSLLVTTAGLAIIVPGALLAAVTPMVTKLRLRSLSETGTVVGQVAGIDTAGRSSALSSPASCLSHGCRSAASWLGLEPPWSLPLR